MSSAPAASSAIPDDLIEMGYITGAYGIKGWIKIKPYSAHANDASALLHARVWWLRQVVLPGASLSAAAGAQPETGALNDFERLQVRTQGSELVASLAGIASREQAEALKGTSVSVSRRYFPALDEGEFYWVDLVGMTVANQEGQDFGSVVGLIDNGAHPLLRIVHSSRKDEMLIPFVDHYVPVVDREARHIVVDWQMDY